MKFSVAAAILSAAVASADVLFIVNDFSAGCVSHGSVCLYDFNVYLTGSEETAATPIYCKASVPTTDGTLPPVTNAACINSSRTFSINSTADGLLFSVSQRVSIISYTVGTHLLPKSDITETMSSTGQVQNYDGPTTFNMED